MRCCENTKSLTLKARVISVKQPVKTSIDSRLTFAVSVGASKDGAFLDAPEGLEKAPHIIF